MNYALRNRNINVPLPKTDGFKRHAVNGSAADCEPLPKRPALADLTSVSNVLSNQLLIDSSKKAIEQKKRPKRIVAAIDNQHHQVNSISENIIYEEVFLPEFVAETDPCPEVDFDKDEDDPYAVSAYARDIFRYYQHRERLFQVGNYLPNQRFINRDIRMKLVDWMVCVQEEFEFNHETLYLAVKLVDMYFDRKADVLRNDLQLLAATCFFIAAKFDERSPPYINDVLYICGENKYSREQLIVMERDILITVGFDLGVPLSYRFLRRYSRVIKMDMTTLTLGRYVLETSLMFFEFVHVSESLMAAASLLLALRMKQLGDWSPILQKYSGFKLEQVEPLMYCLNHMLIKRAANFDRLQTIFTKYSHPIFHQVAQTPLLVSPIPISDAISAPSELNRA